MSTGASAFWARYGNGVIAVGVAAALLVTGVSQQGSATGRAALGYVLLAAGGLVLAARGRAPVAVLVLTGLCALGHQAARASNGRAQDADGVRPPHPESGGCADDGARWRARLRALATAPAASAPPPPVSALALRGCPMCWTMGLVQTMFRDRPQRSCEGGT
ncbi:hypothetical protein [Streptomyces sp. BR123]|uniref:hypothetical protein n=1 Tax=Streptomyces sp. BR123 TaxID=2749828 RepID=UPI0027BA6E8A|nr:hypothetical protein [Streptomyces sp. BR123]